MGCDCGVEIDQKDEVGNGVWVLCRPPRESLDCVMVRRRFWEGVRGVLCYFWFQQLIFRKYKQGTRRD